jgi:alkylation response protein AidB-like acyl-CoA dehydrogenase
MSHRLTDRARALQPLIRAEAAASEAGRTLSTPVVQALLEARVFDMAVPAELGGGEVDYAAYLETIEAVAEGDGSAGWCTMIAAECNAYFARLLPVECTREAFAGGPIATGGSAVPAGPVCIELEGDAAYLTGRWRFASGSRHCAYLFASAPLTRDGAPLRDAAGHAQTAMAFVRREQVTIHDTWHTSGLRGTGSNGFEAARALVGPGFLAAAGPRGPESTMMRFPQGAFLAMGKAAVATGIARAAIEELVRLAETKVPWLSGAPLRDEVRTQLHVADAEALLQSGRGFLYNAAREAWESTLQDGRATRRQAALVRLAAVHAVRSACEAVELMYHAAGATSLSNDSPLQRAFRDVHAVRQHANVADRFREDTGRVLLGLEPKEAIF